MAVRRLPWGVWYAAGLAALIAVGVCSGDDGGMTPRDREACLDYVMSEHDAAREEGRPPPDGLPDCDLTEDG